MNYKITADSTCDLSPELLEQYGLGLTPLYVQLGEKTYRDGVDIFPDDIYAHVANGGDLATTAAVNLADYVRLFSDLSRKYDFVIHICISSDFSCCYQNACLAAADYDNVYVVDSRNLSTGHGLVVLEAVRLAESGMEPKKIVETLNELSDNVILPIAGVILAIVMTMELIQIITDKNNMHGEVDTWFIFKWVFKTACAVLIVSNTWNIVMGVFDVAQSVVNNASGVVVGNVSLDLASSLADLEARLNEMEVWSLLGLWLQATIVKLTMNALNICIFIIVYGRMIEIYLVTSIAPIPMATAMNREWGQMGQNYLRSLFALGFQGFLIIICVAIYAVLVQNMIVDTNISTAIWSCMGYTVLLCFTLFKTGSLAKSLFNSH